MSDTPSELCSLHQQHAAAQAATQRGALAFSRLLRLAETRDSGQIRRVVLFLAGTYDGQTFRFDLFELRSVDVAISDDMLACIDALLSCGIYSGPLRQNSVAFVA